MRSSEQRNLKGQKMVLKKRIDIIGLKPVTKKQVRKYLRIHKQVRRFYGIPQKPAMHKGGLR
jgi:type II secretory pathway predicted ATPase ExeA